MSAIDQYSHEILGTVRCPSSYPLIFKSDWDGVEEQEIPIYRLLEDVSSTETDFDGKVGDIILGGGGGEAQAMRINPREAFLFFTGSSESTKDFTGFDNIFKAFWSMNTAYYFCEGFKKIGWDGKEQIELWLTEHILTFLQENYSEDYADVIGPKSLEQNGDICRLSTDKDIVA